MSSVVSVPETPSQTPGELLICYNPARLLLRMLKLGKSMGAGKHLEHKGNPAQGERNAIGGYFPQYQIGAWIIYRRLRAQELEWIRLADPSAGRVDDLVLKANDVVHGHQVKWSVRGGNFTYKDLAGTALPLIQQLFDGWNKLIKDYAPSRVSVHLITNEQPSTSTNAELPVGSPPPRHRSFAAFVHEVWKPFKDGTYSYPESIPACWKAAWTGLADACGTDTETFWRFAGDLELEFSAQLPETIVQELQDGPTVLADVRSLTERLFATVAHPSNAVELSVDELLRKMGWTDRQSFRSTHRFYIDRKQYVPNVASLDRLGAIVDRLAKGYVALVGGPGTGKSTLLTDFIETRSERVIRYYAYVPNSPNPNERRGESENFLHDLILQIERSGFRSGAALSAKDRLSQIDRLHSLLGQLGNDWRENGRRTLILVDGLDHVEREQAPLRSLLKDLPSPATIEDGVLFVLGTQTLDILQPAVKEHVRAGRCITIGPLSSTAVNDFCTRTLPLSLRCPDVVDKLRELANGHPLILTYLARLLHDLDGPESALRVLDSETIYSGDIEASYESYWSQLNKSSEFAELAGAISRLRIPIDPEWLAQWNSVGAVRTFFARLQHLFVREAPNRFYFYHNSFRLFLIRKSAELLTGLVSTAADKHYHEKLAVEMLRASPDSPYNWESIYHLNAAGATDLILSTANAEFFEQQLSNFREAHAIFHDIKLSIRHAGSAKEFGALTRLIFLATEFNNRSDHLSEIDVADYLFRLGRTETVLHLLRSGSNLKVSRESALDYAYRFYLHSNIQESTILYEISEPLDLLMGNGPRDDWNREDGDTLIAWAQVAVLHRPLDWVFAKIESIKYRSHFHESLAYDEARRFRNKLLVTSGRSLLKAKSWDAFSEVLSRFELENPEDAHAWTRLQLDACSQHFAANDRGEIAARLVEVREHVHQLPFVSVVDAAEAHWRFISDNENALEILKDVDQPSGVTEFHDLQLADFMPRFKLNRTMRILGNSVSATVAVPGSMADKHWQIAIFERAIVHAAHIWADGFRGFPLDMHQVKELLVFFNATPEAKLAKGFEGRSFHYLQAPFFDLLAKCVSMHGIEALNFFVEAVELEWKRVDNSNPWNPYLKRKAVESLHECGVGIEWCRRQLLQIANEESREQEAYERVRRSAEWVDLWISVGEQQTALELLKDLVQDSVGVGYRKDYQLERWIDWLEILHNVNPIRATHQISWFAAALSVTEAEDTRNFCQHLLRRTFELDRRVGVRLLRWLLGEHMISFRSGLHEALLSMLTGCWAEPDLVISLVKHLAIPFCVEPAKLPIQSWLRVHCGDAEKEVQEELDHAISTLAAASQRSAWRAAIVGRITPQEPGSAEDSSGFVSTLDRLILRTGEELGKSEVKNRCTDAGTLCGLLDNEAPHSEFSWWTIVCDITATCNKDELRAILERLRKRPPSELNHAYYDIAVKLHELGDFTGAWDTAALALEGSSHREWDDVWQSGIKLKCWELCAQIDAERVRCKSLEMFLRDLESESWHPIHHAQNWYRLLRLFQTEPAWDETGQCLFKYLEKLVAVPADEVEKVLQNLDPGMDEKADALCALFADLLTSGALMVSEQTVRLLAEVVATGAEPVISWIGSVDIGHAAQFEAQLLKVLHIASMMNEDVAIQNKDLFSRAVVSMSAAARLTALEVHGAMEWRIPQRPGIELPPIYRLVLQTDEIDDVDFDRTGSRKVALVGSDSDWPEPLLADFRELSRIATVPLQNLLARADQIKAAESLETWCSSASEDTLTDRLRSAGLQFTFERPQYRKMIGALRVIVAELEDSGRLRIEDNPNLLLMLRHYDPWFYLFDCIERPECIGKVSGVGRYGDVERDWHLSGPESSVFAKALGDFVVVAERTSVRINTQNNPNELRERFCYVGSHDSGFLDARESAFEFRVKLCMPDYFYDDPVDPPPKLFIKNGPLGISTAGTDWIAIHPGVCATMGWVPMDEGLFSWKDTSGNLVAYTLWWRDGLLHDHRPQFRDEVGEGWLVCVHRTGLDDLIRTVGRLTFCAQVTREARIDKETVSKVHYIPQQ